MKNNKAILGFTFLFIQIGFSQIGKLINGKVICQNNPIQGIQIINLVSEKIAVSNYLGEFAIEAKPDEMLIIGSKDYEIHRKSLSEIDFKDKIIIDLIKKPEELDEVVVTKKPEMNIGNMQDIINRQYVADEKTSPKNRNVYDGSIENGMDFVQIFKLITNLIKKKKPNKKDTNSELDFTSTALKRNDKQFFTKTLQLSQSEIPVFLLFCENDPKSKLVLQPKDIFSMIEFLIAKNKEFKTITTFEK